MRVNVAQLSYLAGKGSTPGQRVADLAAAGGYTTELLARAVGPTGKVYGQNSKWLIENFASITGSWTIRQIAVYSKNGTWIGYIPLGGATARECPQTAQASGGDSRADPDGLRCRSSA